jgi:serralysin
MVVKLLSGGTDADLNTAADNFGKDADLIGIGVNSFGYDYIINTYAGNDIVDATGGSAGDSHYIATGSGNDTVIGGGAFVQSVFDQSGNDYYNMRGGADEVSAGRGRDTIYGGGGIDEISFRYIYSNTLTQTTNAQGVIVDLGQRGVQNLGVFGHDVVRDFEDVVGGLGADRLFGTNAANRMDTNYGNDLVSGRGGADTLFARNGSDTLIGGGGADSIYLSETSAARDVVRYSRIIDSSFLLSENQTDSIFDFDRTGPTRDKLDLSAIDAQPGTPKNDAFIFRGDGTFTLDRGEVSVTTIGNHTVVRVDNDGDGASEMNFWVYNLTTLTAADFIL